MPTKTRDAKTAYDENAQAIRGLIQTLSKQLDAHAAEKVNWSRVGDLGHVRSELDQVRAFLANEEV